MHRISGDEAPASGSTSFDFFRSALARGRERAVLQAELNSCNERLRSLWGAQRIDETIEEAHRCYRLSELVYGPDALQSAAPLINLGVLYGMRQEHDRAALFYQAALTVLDHHPLTWDTSAQVYERLGSLRLAQNSPIEAVVLFRTALKLHLLQGAPAAILGGEYLLLGTGLAKMGATEEYRAAFRQALRYLQHEGPARAHYLVAEAYRGAGERKSAEWHLKKALAKEPHDRAAGKSTPELCAEMHEQLASVYMDRGQWEKAERELLDALRISRSPQRRLQLGRCYREQRRYDIAGQVLQSVLAGIEGQSPSAVGLRTRTYHELARCAAETGQPETAAIYDARTLLSACQLVEFADPEKRGLLARKMQQCADQLRSYGEHDLAEQLQSSARPLA